MLPCKHSLRWIAELSAHLAKEIAGCWAFPSAQGGKLELVGVNGVPMLLLVCYLAVRATVSAFVRGVRKNELTMERCCVEHCSSILPRCRAEAAKRT